MQNIEDLKQWAGVSSGRFHIDFLGVKTNPGFWPGIKPTRPGRLKVGYPGPGEARIEYAACVLAASSKPKGIPFHALEIGAGWGLWSVRSAAAARLLGRPCRTISIEALRGHCKNISDHLLANGLDPACHEVVESVLAGESGEVFLRFTGESDLAARVVAESWVDRNTAIPPSAMPKGRDIPCKDGTFVRKCDAVTIGEVIQPNTRFDFIHIRTGPGQQQFLDSRVFQAKNVGLLVMPRINSVDLPEVEKRMQELRIVPVLSLNPGDTIPTNAAPVTLKESFRVYAGSMLTPEEQDEANSRLSALLAN